MRLKLRAVEYLSVSATVLVEISIILNGTPREYSQLLSLTIQPCDFGCVLRLSHIVRQY